MLRVFFAAFLVALTFLFSPVSYAQEHFTSCYNGSGNIYNATIIVPVSSRPAINGSLLAGGSEIAVFSATSGSLDECVGVMVWQNRSAAITIWGDDELTRYRDGLFSEEAFSFRVWDASLAFEYPTHAIIPSFSVGSPRYGHDEMYVLSRFNVYWSFSGITVTDDTAVTEEDTSVTVDVLANDFDSDGDGLIITKISGPANGVASVTPEAYIQYEPHNNFYGRDSLSYVVSDGMSSVAQGNLIIDVASVNDVPVFTSTPPTQVTAEQPYFFTVAAYDVESDSLTIRSLSLPPWLYLTTTGPFTADVTGSPSAVDIGEHEISVEVSDGLDTASLIFTITVSRNQLALDNEDEAGLTLPTSVQLHPNYPNPFNPATTFVYELPRALHVRIEIFNVLGVRIQTLVDEMHAAGRHELQWTAEHLPSGIYIYRLMAGSAVLTRTLSLTK